MANHQIPRTAKRIRQDHGIDADGNVITVAVFRHVRQGHTLPVYYLVQYRENNRKIDRDSRVTQQFSGTSGQQRLDAELAETRRLLAGSRERAARVPQAA